jgi:hypothetical protein
MALKKTLEAAIASGALGVTVYCRACAKSKRFTADDALERWGTHATFPEIARRARCRDCGRRAFEAAPVWPLTRGGTGPGVAIVPEGW